MQFFSVNNFKSTNFFFLTIYRKLSSSSLLTRIFEALCFKVGIQVPKRTKFDNGFTILHAPLAAILEKQSTPHPVVQLVLPSITLFSTAFFSTDASLF